MGQGMVDRRRGDAPVHAATAARRYRVELVTADRTVGFPCAAGVFPHPSTLDPFVSLCLRDGIREGELRLVDAADGAVVARRQLGSPVRRRPARDFDGARPERWSVAMNGHLRSADGRAAPALAVSDRARSKLVDLHRRVSLPPGMTIAILPGDDGRPRFAAKRPDASDRVAARHADGSPMLVVPALAAEALAGATLDFDLAPEPGFVVLQ